MPMVSVTTDARADLRALDPLAAPHEGSLAARKRKSEVNTRAFIGGCATTPRLDREAKMCLVGDIVYG